MGRQARTKQADPLPFAGGGRAHPGAPERKGKRKLVAEAKSERVGGTQQGPRAAKRAKKVSEGGAEAMGKGKAVKGKGKGKAEQKKKVTDGVEWESDDDEIEGMKAEDGWTDEEDEMSDAEANGLEKARSALFDDVDLEEPGAGGDELDDEFDLDRADDDDEDDLDDEFDLDDDEVDGGTEEDETDALAKQGLSKKRAARGAAYNSDDDSAEDSEDDSPLPAGLNPARPDPEPIAGQVDATMEELEAARSDEDGEDDSDEEGGMSRLQDGKLEDLRQVEKRMRTAARVLAHWKELGAQAGMGVERFPLRDCSLISDICQYHGYTPFLAEKLFDVFSPEEALEFFSASDTPRPLTIRVNTLKTRRRDLAQALINRGVNLQPLEGGWSKVGLQVFSGSSVPIGATPEYLAGHYILQAASSFLPVMALDPQPHERCLDMSAAPGGKTTYMSALMGNTGEVWANDSSRGRIKGLGGNVARLGCRNVVITNVDGREFPKIMGGFDRVLLDAPCSGTGVISKDPSVKVNKTERDFMLLSHLQKQLLLCAIDSVSPNSEKGGYVCYSTCSVTVEENEAVVSYALRKRPHVKLVDTGLPFGKPGFKSYKGKEFGKGIELTRRFYPHVANVDGFFVAVVKVGKPQKHVPEPASPTLPYEPLPLNEKDEQEAAEAKEDAPAFDDEEDAKLIEESRRKIAKRKGLNPKADKSKAGKKARVEKDE
ncbi:nucleolar protein NOP2 [Rhodotorula toruloides]|uniref:Nucleolar protein 2 n=1 Tax=Rhodotorula toruloides TaxID=5286 RepID=A0A511K9J1_RHOTO|nr:nucleolar protein NOP2 [Rhodotorula toruloides]